MQVENPGMIIKSKPEINLKSCLGKKRPRASRVDLVITCTFTDRLKTPAGCCCRSRRLSVEGEKSENCPVYRTEITRILLERLFYYKFFVRIRIDSTPRKEGETVEKTRQARWDAGHISSATTRLPRCEYLALRDACALEGTTVYALLARLIRAWMVEFRAEHPAWESAVTIRKEYPYA